MVICIRFFFGDVSVFGSKSTMLVNVNYPLSCNRDVSSGCLRNNFQRAFCDMEIVQKNCLSFL